MRRPSSRQILPAANAIRYMREHILNLPATEITQSASKNHPKGITQEYSYGNAVPEMLRFPLRGYDQNKFACISERAVLKRDLQGSKKLWKYGRPSAPHSEYFIQLGRKPGGSSSYSAIP